MSGLGPELAPAKLQVDELRLVAMTANDGGRLYKIHDDNRAFWAQTLDYAAGYTPEQAQESCEEAVKLISRGALAKYWITDSSGTEDLGLVDMSFREDGRAKGGYQLDKTARGRGVATRAFGRLIDYAFNERRTPMTVVELDIRPDNEASRRVAELLRATMTGNKTDKGLDIWEVRPVA